MARELIDSVLLCLIIHNLRLRVIWYYLGSSSEHFLYLISVVLDINDGTIKLNDTQTDPIIPTSFKKTFTLRFAL